MAQEINSSKDHLSFLCYCLSEHSTPVPECVKRINWTDLLKFGLKQGIAGIYAYTILENNKALEDVKWYGNCPAPREVLKWSKFLINIRERNKRINRYTAKAVNGFAQSGIRTCILKGQGNTLFYKNPYIRSSGDIDIWADAPRMKLFALVRSIFPEAPFKCQHIDFPVWKEAPVEVHFFPMYLENPISNYRLNRFFKKEKEKQFSNKVSLPGTNCKIAIPAPLFNAVYQLTHINVHILIEGIGLRQFIDYYYVLRQLNDEDRQTVAKLVSYFKIRHLAESVMYIEHTILGLDEKYLFVKPDEKRGAHLAKQIIADGNFGRHNADNPGDRSFWKKQFWKLKRNAHFVFDYPSEELWEPVFRIAHFLWRVQYDLKWKLLSRYYKDIYENDETAKKLFENMQ